MAVTRCPTRLDKFTSQLNVGPVEPYLWAGNEPNFSVPWLYNYLGQPWKTQELVDRMRSTLFSPTPDGEPGNDDLGAMSAWYVWASLGLYPIIPGTSTLTVNAPSVRQGRNRLARRQIHSHLRARGVRASPAAVHRRAAYRRAVDEQDVSSGVAACGWRRAGVLAVDRSRTNRGGPLLISAPPSFGAGSVPVTVNVSPSVVAMDAGTDTEVTVNVQRMVDGPSEYEIIGKSFEAGISAESVSGKFGDDGSGTSTVTVKVAESVRDGYYPLELTTKAGKGERTFMLLVAVGEGGVTGG